MSAPHVMVCINFSYFR